MAAKVKWDRGAWWVVTHYQGKRKRKRVGPTNADKREATNIAKKINASMALGTFAPDSEAEKPIPCDQELRRWHATYVATMKPSYDVLTKGHIEKHLIPHFGSQDLGELQESHILGFVQAKLSEGLSPKTIHNVLSTFRRVCTLLEREGRIRRNPAIRIGELMRRVQRATSEEAPEVDYWTRGEVETLIEVAREHEPRFAPVLSLLFATGMRRGEALGRRWSDVDLDRRVLSIRRAIVRGALTSPKSGRVRKIRMTDALASELFDLLAERRQETLGRGWPEVPEYVFCSEVGTALDERNVTRVWARIRRRAQKRGVRPLKLHCARHTWATFALQAGKSIRWVADQLGHADPALTLRVYAHAMAEEEHDLSFAEFGGPGRPYTAPRVNEESEEARNPLKTVARREAFEPPTLRFEA